MKAKAIEIRWHETKPIFSADFHSIVPDKHRKQVHPYAKEALVVAGPSGQSSGSGVQVQPVSKDEDEVIWRLATAGGDNTIRMWSVTPRPHLVLAALSSSKLAVPGQGLGPTAKHPPKPDGGAKVEYLATLKKHTGVVNVVRWSPDGSWLASAGDDGQVLLWREKESVGPAEFGESAEDQEYEREGWQMVRTMRNPTWDRVLDGDFYDLSWSPDSTKLVCGSVNSTFTVFDVATGLPLVHNRDHGDYVQGVAWDPLDQFIATQSSDRSMHVYQIGHSSHGGGFGLSGVGKNTKIEVQHKHPANYWDTLPPPPARQRSHSSHSHLHHPTPTSPAKPRVLDGRPVAHHRSLSRDSTRSDASSARASLADTLASASNHVNLDNASAIDDEPSTPMDPPMYPPRPSSRRSSTTGSFSGALQSPGLTSHLRSPSPAPLPAIMPMSPKPQAFPAPTSADKTTSQRLYAAQEATPFFRRLAWSPDGSLLLTPAGLFEDPYAGVAERAIALQKKASGEEPPLSVKKGKKAADKDDVATAGGPKPTVYVYSRANLARPPVAHLPGHKTTSIAVRFCPVLWKLRKWRGEGDEEEDPPVVSLTKEGVEVALPGAEEEAGGQVDEGKRERSLFDLPYRMVYAVATLDQVFLYDTQQAGPICMFGNLHYAPFTDLSWSSDGQTLVVSSQDGYCSLVTFDPNELGTPYTGKMAAPLPPPSVGTPVPVQAPAPTPTKPAAPAPAASVAVPVKREAAAEASPKAAGGGGVVAEGAPPKKKAKRAVLTQVTPALVPVAGGMVQTTLTGLGAAAGGSASGGSLAVPVGEEKEPASDMVVVD